MKSTRPFHAHALMALWMIFPLTVMAQAPGIARPGAVVFYLTNPDKSALFQRQNDLLFHPAAEAFPGKREDNPAASAHDHQGKTGADGGAHPTILVDTTQTFQSMDGFGFSLTGGSAALIDGLPAAERCHWLHQLFSTDSGCIGISYLRISIGSSDLDSSVFTYDDMPRGKKDPGLANFSISHDRQHLIPLLRSILEINPHILILGSPWSAPSWMKDNDTTASGHLRPDEYPVYARYLVRYIQAMKAAGVIIDAITPQNEPMNPHNNPSMVVTDTAEAAFVKTALGPVFKAAGLKTKIIVWDHNCDLPDYPLYILGDPGAAAYVDGSAFHLYRGKISALSTVHNAYPAKNIYFTEEYTAGGSSFGGDLSWHIDNLIIGAPRNWARNVLEWNLASDPDLNPHTPGGCNTCLGALTIGDTVTRNVSYYIIAHASRFVRPGSVRVGSTLRDDLPNVAYQTQEGRKVLIVLNHTGASQTFDISFAGASVTTSLMAGAVGTYVW